MKTKQSAQAIQDTVFRNMSTDKKIELSVKLWKLAKEIAPEKFTYDALKTKTTINRLIKQIS